MMCIDNGEKMMKNKKLCVFVLLCIMGICSFSISAIGDDSETYPKLDSNVTATWAILQNKYLAVEFAQQGSLLVMQKMTDYKPDTTSAVSWPCTGRFGIYSMNGNPNTSNDNGCPLTYLAEYFPAGRSGYFKLCIDPTSSDGTNGTLEVVGDGTTGSWGAGTDNSELWPLAYSTLNGLGDGLQGNYLMGTWDETANQIKTRIEMQLIRDQVRFKFVITNNDTKAHRVGISMNMDVEDSTLVLPKDYVDGDPKPEAALQVISPGYAPFISDTYPNGRLYGLSGYPAIPQYVDLYHNVNYGDVGLRYTLTGADCTTPSSFVVGTYSYTSPETTWITNSYAPDPDASVDDSYVVISWNPKIISPGRSITYVTYCGVPNAGENWMYKSSKNVSTRDTAVTAVQDPVSLSYDTTGMCAEPFRVDAYVDNIATDAGYDLNNVKCSISLPEGLELDTIDFPDVSATQSMGTIPISDGTATQITKSDFTTSEGGVSWYVNPTGYRSGNLKYFVQASSDDGWAQSVEKTIIVPASNKTTLKKGWQLVNVPYVNSDNSVAGLFGSDYNTQRYDALTRTWSKITSITPGKAFWIKSGGTEQIDLPSTVSPAQTTDTSLLKIDLKPGWNMVGNTLLYPIYWGQVMFKDSSNVQSATYNLDLAVSKHMVYKTIYSWNVDKGAYNLYKTNDTMLDPWTGYWVYAYKSCQMILSEPSYPNSTVLSSTSSD